MPFQASFDLPPHATLAVACSGGADSVYLVRALQEHLSQDSQVNVQSSTFKVQSSLPLILHANHQLRGAESDADACFVEALASQLGWQLVTERLAVPQHPSEANLRDLRHAFFRRALSSFPRPVVLLFGHHLDDAAESVLMRLVRGSSSSGLAAPRYRQEIVPGWFHVRPLLGLRRSEIRQSLAAQQVVWREDSSNAVPDPFRNRLRLEFLPALAAASGRDPAPGLARARLLAEEEDDALNVWLAQLLPSLFQPSQGAETSFSLATLQGLPTALWRRALERVLLRLLPRNQLALSAKESLLRHLQEGSDATCSAGPLNFVTVSRHKITLLSTAPDSTPASATGCQILELDSTLRLESGWRVHLESDSWPRPCPQIPASRVPWDSAHVVHLTPELAQPLQVRLWKQGDRFRPLRHPGSAKLQDLFVNRHIPRHLRAQLPIVTDSSGRILAVPGLPPAHDFQVAPHSSSALRLTFTPPATT